MVHISKCKFVTLLLLSLHVFTLPLGLQTSYCNPDSVFLTGFSNYPNPPRWSGDRWEKSRGLMQLTLLEALAGAMRLNKGELLPSQPFQKFWFSSGIWLWVLRGVNSRKRRQTPQNQKSLVLPIINIIYTASSLYWNAGVYSVLHFVRMRLAGFDCELSSDKYREEPCSLSQAMHSSFEPEGWPNCHITTSSRAFPTHGPAFATPRAFPVSLPWMFI